VPVLCGIDRLGATIRQHDIAEVIVASSLLAADNRERLERVCDEADVQVVQASMRLE